MSDSPPAIDRSSSKLETPADNPPPPKNHATDTAPSTNEPSTSDESDMQPSKKSGGRRKTTQTVTTPSELTATGQGSDSATLRNLQRVRAAYVGRVIRVQLKDLVPSGLPGESALAERVTVMHKSKDARLNDGFVDETYIFHPATEAALAASIAAAVKPITAIKMLPAVSSGIIVVCAPYDGAELYVKALCRKVAASDELFDGVPKREEVLYLEVSNNDIFHRFAGWEVMTSLPFRKKGKNRTTHLQLMQGIGGAQHSIGMIPGAIISIGGMSPGRPNGPFMANGADEDGREVPEAPYPFHKSYRDKNGDSLQLLVPKDYPDKTGREKDSNDEIAVLTKSIEAFFDYVKSLIREDSDDVIVINHVDLVRIFEESDEAMAIYSDALNRARQHFRIAVVAPFTNTYERLPSKQPQNGKEGFAAFLQEFQESTEHHRFDNDEPSLGPVRGASKVKQLSFETPLDEYLGIVTVPVFPPVHLGAQAVRSFRKRLKSDLKLIFRSANVDMINLHMRQIANDDYDLESHLANSKNLAVLDDRELRPTEIERIVSLALGAEPDVTVTEKHWDKAFALFGALARGADTVRAGTEFAGLFANPRDILRLSKHEQRLLHQCLVKPEKLETRFDSIGGLAKTKEVVKELIRLPLLRPELFRKGILKQSTTGILLFGPPGTGKTMLARAVAAESGANFLNVQMSNVSSMWAGENEKNVKALFSLARKLRPCVIFVDEIDALLKVRHRNQPSWVTNTINEWMMEWDGIQSDNSRGVIVVGTTNRPFDLDEAVLRRLPRRILVNLPTALERQEILKVMLSDENVAERDATISTVCELTEDYSGSDLKNLCIAAALRAVRDAGESSSDRILNLEHFRDAIKAGDVVPGLSEKAELRRMIVEWDKVYGTAAGGYDRGVTGWGFEHIKRVKD